MKIPSMSVINNAFNRNDDSNIYMSGRAKSIVAHDKYNKKDKRLW